MALFAEINVTTYIINSKKRIEKYQIKINLLSASYLT